MRTPIAVAISILMLAGCVSGVPPSSPAPSSLLTASSDPSLPASAEPLPQPTPIASAVTAWPTPAASPSPAQPDRYSPALAGRLFFLAGSDPHDLTLGRIGIPGRLALGAANAFLGTVGDRVVTASTSGTGSPLRLWSFVTGGQVGHAIELGTGERFAAIAGDRVVTVSATSSGSLIRLWSVVTGDQVGKASQVSGIREPFVVAAGSELIVGSMTQPNGLDPGVVDVSGVDGSVRSLVGPASVVGLPSPERVLVVSTSGSQLATTVCATGVDAVYDCRPTTVLDISSGNILATLDLSGRQPALLTEGWLLAALPSGDQLLDREGHVRWTTASLGQGAGVWANQVSPAGDLVVEIRSIAGNVKPVLLAVDPATGRQTTLYGARVAANWHVWPSLSTANLVAIGFDDFNPPCMATPGCGPDDPRVADASTVDLTTGKITPHAIHITFAP